MYLLEALIELKDQDFVDIAIRREDKTKIIPLEEYIEAVRASSAAGKEVSVVHRNNIVEITVVKNNSWLLAYRYQICQ